jgi:hypothetical protein
MDQMSTQPGKQRWSLEAAAGAISVSLQSTCATLCLATSLPAPASRTRTTSSSRAMCASRATPRTSRSLRMRENRLNGTLDGVEDAGEVSVANATDDAHMMAAGSDALPPSYEESRDQSPSGQTNNCWTKFAGTVYSSAGIALQEKREKRIAETPIQHMKGDEGNQEPTSKRKGTTTKLTPGTQSINR